VFEEFSAAERILRLSPVFGERGVPAPPSYGRAHPSFIGGNAAVNFCHG
jgi:hypothetical protein